MINDLIGGAVVGTGLGIAYGMNSSTRTGDAAMYGAGAGALTTGFFSGRKAFIGMGGTQGAKDAAMQAKGIITNGYEGASARVKGAWGAERGSKMSTLFGSNKGSGASRAAPGRPYEDIGLQQRRASADAFNAR